MGEHESENCETSVHLECVALLQPASPGLCFNKPKCFDALIFVRDVSARGSPTLVSIVVELAQPACLTTCCCYIAAHGVTDDSDWEYEIARIVLIAALSAV